MAGSAAGAEKTAAKRLGIPIEEYAARLDAGERWCWDCREWLFADQFRPDRSRGRGLDAKCRACSIVRRRAAYVPVVNRRRMGPLPAPQRDGDKRQAQSRVNTLVNRGALPRPDSLPCTDCGHLGADMRHEYDHYLGYGTGNHEKVQPVCTLCHHHRDCKKYRQTECLRGHAYTADNTGRKPNGTRFCKECRRASDRNRVRPAGYWREVNARRKAKNYHKKEAARG